MGTNIDYAKGLPMSAGEIVTSYRQARNKRMQITILADLNVTSKRRIRQILYVNNALSEGHMPSINCADAQDAAQSLELRRYHRWQPEDYEKLLRLRDVEGMPYTNIAKVIGASYASVTYQYNKIHEIISGVADGVMPIPPDMDYLINYIDIKSDNKYKTAPMRRWTTDEIEQMDKLRKANVSWARIGNILGRSETACKSQYRTKGRHASGR